MNPTDMDFVRLYVFRTDYHWLLSCFGHGETRPAKGELIHRALEELKGGKQHDR